MTQKTPMIDTSAWIRNTRTATPITEQAVEHLMDQQATGEAEVDEVLEQKIRRQVLSAYRPGMDVATLVGIVE